jgi:hypothetical protein
VSKNSEFKFFNAAMDTILKADPAKVGIMLKKLAIFTLFLLVFSLQTYAQPHKAQDGASSQKPTAPTTSAPTQQTSSPKLQTEHQKHVDADVRVIQAPQKDAFDVSTLIINIVLGAVGIAGVGVGIFGIIYAKRTLAQISTQTKRLGEHAEHFSSLATAAEDAARAAKDSLDLSRDTAKKQLRAYFGTVAGTLYIYDDGTVEPRVTFINCGQTPAYDLQVIESGRFETPPFKKVPPPDQEGLQSHPHVVGGGQPHYFTCRKIPYSQGKQQLLSDLSGPNYAFILNLWCTYRDIFKDFHPVNVQLIIGGGTALQRTIDANGEWFGLFTDSEGNTYD